MEDIMTSVLQSTFSIAVAAFLLVRMEHRLDELTKAIYGLRVAIDREGASADGAKQG